MHTPLHRGAARWTLFVCSTFIVLPGCGPDNRQQAGQVQQHGNAGGREWLTDAQRHPRRNDTGELADPRYDGDLRETQGSVQALRRRIETTSESLKPIPPRTPEGGRVRPRVAAAPASAAADQPGVEWLNPDRMALVPPQSPAPRLSGPAPQPQVQGAGSNVPISIPSQGNGPSVPLPAPVRPGDGPAYTSTNQSVTAATTLTGDEALLRRLGQHVRDYPHDLAGHLDYQLLRFIRDEPVPQLDALTGLPQEDRNLVSAVMDGLNNFRVAARTDSKMLLSQKVRPILEMADRLRDQAELNIPTIAVCSRVQAFGVYDAMSTTFRAGQDNPLILYCEVQNFASTPNGNGLWETRLKQQVALYMEGQSNFEAWKDKGDTLTDQCHNRRHDYYVVKKIILPKTLSVGRYILKVSVIDEQAKRIAENTVTINVIAQ